LKIDYRLLKINFFRLSNILTPWWPIKLCLEAWSAWGREIAHRQTDGRWRRTVYRLLMMMMSIEIASVLSHRVSQEAVNTREQLSSTLTRLTTQTDAGIVVTS